MKRYILGQGIAWGICLGGLGGWSGQPLPAVASEQVVLKYAPLSRTLPMSALRQLADTGQPTSQLRQYLKLANQSPEEVQAGLTDSIEMDHVRLDQMLNSPLGDIFLDEVSLIVHTPTNLEDRKALRSALILDASDDGQLTVIDTLENYPTTEVTVEGRRLARLFRRIEGFQSQRRAIEPLLKILTDIFP
jgi:hypothetical protein